GIVEGTLELVENLGEYALVHLRTATGVEFIAKTETPPEASTGSNVSFNINADLAHFFDNNNGTRLA
ncbi:MAG: TOBE domain-containing protein, partial [Pseudomonadota bacterium]